ncbi:MAG: hypothetical protein KJ689_01155 [Bacteroidetes bacterium]|nr:hypothetical protein [Bacteroidota bacterium]
MDANLNEEIRLHSAGATVRHKTNFDNLKSHNNNFELNQEFIDKWVNPFYMTIGNYNDNNWVESIKQIHEEITPEITLTLLGDFNWRTRLVGAYFSAIKDYKEQIEIIGTHFLKSEVCCVGHIYALVFAFYNNEKSIKYLTEYLDYYLQKPELYFDQESALEALSYIDTTNGTSYCEKFSQSWIKLQQDRQELSKLRAIEVSRIIEQQEGKEVAENYLKNINSIKSEVKMTFNIEYTTQQIEIMKELKKYCC